MKTGVSGETALTSSRVGMRRSANWNSLQPPTTRTHCGDGVRRACSRSVRQAGHAVPAQLQVVVEPAADEVQVRIVQPGDDRSAARVDHLRLLPAQRQDVLLATDRDESALPSARAYGITTRFFTGSEVWP